MSLIRFAVRTAAAEALKGNTLVGDNVLDSQIGALTVSADGTVRLDQETRFIAVYTQDGEATLDRNDVRAILENGSLVLVFETGITAAMAIQDPDTGDQMVVDGVPATDAAFEFYLDILGRQIIDALMVGTNTWAEIWRGLVCNVTKVETLRTDDGSRVRLAGHQIRLTCDVVADPVRGAAIDPETPFGAFVDALEQSGDSDAIARATQIRAILDQAVMPAGEETRQRLGLSPAELAALGIAAAPTDDGTEADLSSGTVSIDGLGDQTAT